MKKKKRKWPKFVALSLLAVVIVCAVAGLLIYNYATKSYDGERVRIYVDASKGNGALRDSLVARLGEDYGDRVYSLWEKIADDTPLRSGSYVVEPGERAWRLANRIKKQYQNPVKVTFNNIRTYGQLMSRLDAQLLADSTSLSVATDSLLAAQGVNRENYPAHFIPDTYEFYWTESAPNVIAKLISNYDKFWTGDRCEKAAALNLTPEQVSTLASIVEEETNKSDERPKVARLYLNRLAKGMKLQADPTVKFAVGDFTLKRILQKHLQSTSRYNTYMYEWLPPGPIRLPEKATLDAVLNAPTHNYIYMCAKEDFSGYHNFTADYATHQSNAKRYREALNHRNIK